MIDVFARQPDPPAPAPLLDAEALAAAIAAAVVTSLAALPVPQVHVEPVDITDLVNAVVGIKGPATAEEIGAVVARLIAPTQTAETESGVVAAIRELVEKVDFRLKGVGIQAYGGGSVSLQAGQTVTALTGARFALDPNNSTTVALTAGVTFTGTSTDISNYAQVTIEMYGTPSTAGGTLFFEFSPDNVNWDVSVPTLISDPTFVIPIALIPVGRYFRVRYLNDGGVAAGGTGTPASLTALRLNTYLFTVATKELARTLSQTIRSSDPCGLNRVVVSGLDPDGAYTNAAVVGTRTLSPATSVLGVNAVYTSTWMDSESFPTVRLLVSSDQISADNGIKIEWSDTAAGTAVRSAQTNSFRQGHIANGRFINYSTRARYFRITYTNGSVAQTRFFLNLRMNPYPLVDEVRLVSAAAAQTGQQDVTVTGTALPSALVGRRGIRLKCLTISARPLQFGFISSLTSLNGDELAAGESIDLDIDDTITVYVITTSTAGAGVRCSWTEVA